MALLDRDISQSTTFQDVKRRHEDILQPGKNEAINFEQFDFSPDGKRIAGAATFCKKLQGFPTTRLAIIDIDDGHISTFGDRGSSDTQPKWSPDGAIVSFLSEVDNYNQLLLLDIAIGNVKVATELRGSIEQQSWSQNGKKILLLVAGLGADRAGVQGGRSLAVESGTDSDKAWMPTIETIPSADAYRTVWVYNVESGSSRRVTPETLNIWQAVWTSSTSVVGICSDLPGEEDWYHSSLREISLENGTVKELFTTDVSMEWLAVSPSGDRVAFATGLASDRQVLTGDLYIVEIANGNASLIDTNEVNVNAITWCGDNDIAASGIRNDEQLVIHYNITTKKTLEIWRSRDHTVGSRHFSHVSAHKSQEVQIAFIREGWFDPPTLVHLSGTKLKEVKNFSPQRLQNEVKALGSAQSLRWAAPDGLEIYGYFLAPSRPGPHPTILHIHGGPVGGWLPRYVGRDIELQAFLAAGFAVFEPNVRGSWGRGQSFAQHVFGDMGGKDTYDYLSGLDALIKSGQSDPKRLGVFGSSYGGFMSSWLVTQTDRFAAAVAVSPVTDWVSEHYTSNLGKFCQDFLGDDVHDPHGKYFTRAPLHHVRAVKTPTLSACAAQDKNTPPGQAMEFHRALVEQGTTSALVTYPNAGHSVRQMPESFDLLARTVEWFRTYV